MASSAPMKNGMRQPKAVSCSAVMKYCSVTRTSEARSWPPIRVTYWNEAKNPRRPLIATSLIYVAEVPYSPPTDRPWSMRASNNSTGASVPTVA